ncbi:hypothetical protein ABQF35_29525 [Mycobacterium syngnathidarum]
MDHGWTLVEPQTMIDIRIRGATVQLTRILGEKPSGIDRALELLETAQDGLLSEGWPMFASLRAQPLPETKLGCAWRLADILREYRSDSDIAAWTSEGLAALEIEVRTDLFIGAPVGVAPPPPWQWSPEERDAAQHRLRERGLITGVGLSENGQALRKRIEVATERQYRPVIDPLGEDVDELMRIATGWSTAVQASRGFIAGLDDWLGATASSR